MKSPTVNIRVPTAPSRRERPAPTFLPTVPLSGSRVGLRYEGTWHSWNFIVHQWQQELRSDGAVVHLLKAPNGRIGIAGENLDASVDEWISMVDFGVAGLGTCGACTVGAIEDAVSLESAGKPAVAAICEEFYPLARSIATTLGHGDLRILVFPYPLESRGEDVWRQIAADFYPQFLDLVGVDR